jgi:hypothetical protein
LESPPLLPLTLLIVLSFHNARDAKKCSQGQT